MPLCDISGVVLIFALPIPKCFHTNEECCIQYVSKYLYSLTIFES